MDQTTLRLVIVIAVLAASAAFGLWRRRRDGRLRAVDPRAGAALTAADLAEELGSRATLLQFSSEFCAPCRATHRLLGQVAAPLPGVRHVELDVAEHLGLTRRLNVLRTPTVIVLDGDGHPVHRFSGVPRLDQLRSAVAALSPELSPAPAAVPEACRG
jgi:thioredoxin-like negative regulator of GroEL